MSKKSENSSEPRIEQDGMNEYVEIAGEVKDNAVGKHKPENISGQDEKNKSIEGKEEMEWLDHSEVQSQKHASFVKGLLLCDYQVDMFFFGVDDNKSAAMYVIATLSVYLHRASLKNMPGHGGIRTYDLWNGRKVVGSNPTVARHIFEAFPVWIYTQSSNYIHLIHLST